MKTQPVIFLPILLILALALMPLPAESARFMQQQPRPSAAPQLGKGVFLVASPEMKDPNFQQTVILLCEHNPDEGTLGVIMNRPTGLLLSEVLPKIPVLKGTSYVLFAGGPVQPDGILMLFRVMREPADMRRVLSGIYLGGNMDMLERIVTKPEPTETFRAYAGYAGWAPGQLEAEVAVGSWIAVPADPLSIFDKDPATLWRDLWETPRTPGVVRSDHLHISSDSFFPRRPGEQGVRGGASSGIIKRAS
jgi:putative transcriptional regulator